jgi:hypothetical protein
MLVTRLSVSTKDVALRWALQMPWRIFTNIVGQDGILQRIGNPLGLRAESAAN